MAMRLLIVVTLILLHDTNPNGNYFATASTTIAKSNDNNEGLYRFRPQLRGGRENREEEYEEVVEEQGYKEDWDERALWNERELAGTPTGAPTTWLPTATADPTVGPTTWLPTVGGTTDPTVGPTTWLPTLVLESTKPSGNDSPDTDTYTPNPTKTPTVSPTIAPGNENSTPRPTDEITPTANPTAIPTKTPTARPTGNPTKQDDTPPPTKTPTANPTQSPTTATPRAVDSDTPRPTDAQAQDTRAPVVTTTGPPTFPDAVRATPTTTTTEQILKPDLTPTPAAVVTLPSPLIPQPTRSSSSSSSSNSNNSSNNNGLRNRLPQRSNDSQAINPGTNPLNNNGNMQEQLLFLQGHLVRKGYILI